MAHNVKHYIITAVTLGGIAAASALSISGTNLLTKDQIAKNEYLMIQRAITSVFGENIKVSDPQDVPIKYSEGYIKNFYTVKDNSETDVGFAFRTDGKNMYGRLSLIVAFNASKTFAGVSVVVDEQTYATTLEDNYIAPLNEGTRELEDVSCGATYGAKLVRDMVNQSQEVLEELVN